MGTHRDFSMYKILCGYSQGGFFNAVFLLSMAMFVTFEAIGRFLEPECTCNFKNCIII